MIAVADRNRFYNPDIVLVRKSNRVSHRKASAIPFIWTIKALYPVDFERRDVGRNQTFRPLDIDSHIFTLKRKMPFRVGIL